MNLSALVLFAVCLFVTADGGKSLVEEIRDRCRDEHHLQDEQIAEINETRNLETHDQNVKCFVKCMLVGVGVMTEEGEITLGDPSEVKYQKVFPCKDVTGSDTCDKAVNLKICLWEKLKEEEKEDDD